MVAQEQKVRRQPHDPYAQQAKTLTSSVQRLRGWVGSDPSRAPELADALVQLTAHRLLGHAYGAAAADAQEAVRRAAQLLTATGPLGPYTAAGDATRYLTAVIHLATIQAAVGLPDAAGRTIASAAELQQQLPELELEERLEPLTAIWAQSCSARAALAAGEVAAANASADAAVARLADSGLRDDSAAAYLAIDTDRLVADCRWAAGRTVEALHQLQAARDRYEDVVGDRLSEPGRFSPALVERLAEPLFGLYRDLADRLVASGEVDLGLVTRRALVERLRRLIGRLGDPARVQLAAALTDLAGDLLARDRVEEAEDAAAEADRMLPDPSSAAPGLLLARAVHARVLTRTGRSGEALAALRTVLAASGGEHPSAARAVALLALAEALQADGQADAADAAEQEFSDLAGELVGPTTEESQAAARIVDVARGVVSRGVEEPAGAVEDEQPGSADWLAAERDDAHRLELERLEQARVEAERREAERVAAEQAAADRRAADQRRADEEAQREVERRVAAEEAERQERKRRRLERLEVHRLEAEQRESDRRRAELEAEQRQGAPPDELVLAQQAWDDARARGDRRAARIALERVVELLRPRAQRDLGSYGPRLHQALEELSSARLRSGDVWGSRAPAKEAKVLGRALGR